MTHYIQRGNLTVAKVLADFIETEALVDLPLSAEKFWQTLDIVSTKFMPINRELLDIRDQMQDQIDNWHQKNGPVANNPTGYEDFLKSIGYIEDEPADFKITTQNLDPEISQICGPQLVVPVSNARYALNAANARWGSLYDALYGTDAIDPTGDLAIGSEYNEKRGEEVFARSSEYLDQIFPLSNHSHSDVILYAVERDGDKFVLRMEGEQGVIHPQNPSQFVGFSKDNEKTQIVIVNNNLHVILVIDPNNTIGLKHRAHLADIILESAITTIQDCEDSVAAVDADDKVGVYRNWLGLMKGDLVDTFDKNGKSITRKLNDDKYFIAPNGSALTLKGRALQLVRNVGHLMTSDAVYDADGEAIGEGLLDAAVTILCAMHDMKTHKNSVSGSIYIVKPKMHGSTEVMFTCSVFAELEQHFGLPHNTVKIGIMDEERRTSTNLKACIYQARERLFFINTGFLDRTGDEIHTSMEAGPVLLKDQIKSETWIKKYEDRNVLIGLECGLAGVAQIGKGMFAKPDNMAEMLEQKIAHPKAGANTAWVPSPTAATLHALHYHEVDVFEAQKRRHNEQIPSLSELFSMPVLERNSLSESQIKRELNNNAQSILGYVVRWVDMGIGCSKVPDINNIALMEDRATCRISAQSVANWLWHGIVTQDEVVESFARMAYIVDQQNSADRAYTPMSKNMDENPAFLAALALALEGSSQPSGYTEPLLHATRRQIKQARH